MTELFDPYLRWLAIPPHKQPPNAYRLLGLTDYEPSESVIAFAADQRMAYVKAQAGGPHAAESQQLLNELAQARVCLLDPNRKSIYDERLRKNEMVSLAPVESGLNLAGLRLDDLVTPEEITAATSMQALPKIAAEGEDNDQPLFGQWGTKALYAAAAALILIFAYVSISAVASAIVGPSENDGDPPAPAIVESAPPPTESRPEPKPVDRRWQIRPPIATPASSIDDSGDDNGL